MFEVIERMCYVGTVPHSDCVYQAVDLIDQILVVGIDSLISDAQLFTPCEIYDGLPLLFSAIPFQ